MFPYLPHRRVFSRLGRRDGASYQAVFALQHLREIVVVAWLFFNLTFTIFDATELSNHLPFFGVMAMLLVWAPEPETKALWVKGLSESLLPVIRGRSSVVSNPDS